jgi:hypothetical protein
MVQILHWTQQFSTTVYSSATASLKNAVFLNTAGHSVDMQCSADLYKSSTAESCRTTAMCTAQRTIRSRSRPLCFEAEKKDIDCVVRTSVSRNVDPISGTIASTIPELDWKLKNLDRRSRMQVSGVQRKHSSKLVGVTQNRTSPSTSLSWSQCKHTFNILRT